MTECGKCGQKNDPHYKFCLGCGAELPSSAAMPTPTTRGWTDDDAQSADPPASATGLPASAPLHSADPILMSQPATARSCNTCGNIVPTSFTFCGQCGARMDAPAPAARNPSAGAITEGKMILVRADGSEGGSHPLSLGDNAIGRGLGPLFDADGYLSPDHATLVLEATGALIRDNDSLNGVFVRMTEEEELFDGDVFRVGQELLRFDLLPPAEPLADGTHIMGSPPGGAWGRAVLVVSRDQDGSAFPLCGESIVLGRERADILFGEDGYVSGTHARLSLRNGRHYLADLNSSNGSFLRVRGERALPSGSLLLLGQQLFRVVYG